MVPERHSIHLKRRCIMTGKARQTLMRLTLTKSSASADRPKIVIPQMLYAIVTTIMMPPLAVLAADQEIAAYTGEGAGATRPFTVTGPWEAQFKGVATFTLMSSDGKLVDAMGGNKNGSAGSYYSPIPGTYYLNVSAFGPWQVRIVAVRP
jgi:hypothetical protein